MGNINLHTFVVYKQTKIYNIMKPQNTIEKISLFIGSIFVFATFGGALTILLNL